MSAILVTVDSNTKKAELIERIKIDAEFEDSTRYDSDDGKPDHLNSTF
jgi:hypothetical protein